jgi:hypothetical protein
MKLSALIICLCLFTACGKAGKTVVIESRNPVIPTLDFTVDMDDLEDNYFFFAATNSASSSKTAIGTFEIDGADGRAFLGFPTEVSEYYPLSSSSTLSFHSQRLLGNSNNLTLSLFVDAGCDGVFSPASDAIVSFSVTPNKTYTLDQSTPISTITNGSLPGISAGSPFSSLIGKCLINTEIVDVNYPANKKLAGLMIVIGSNVSYEISDVDIRF